MGKKSAPLYPIVGVRARRSASNDPKHNQSFLFTSTRPWHLNICQPTVFSHHNRIP